MTRAIAAKDDGQLGPRMQALSEKRRRFVVELFSDDAPPRGHGLLIHAARAAGYGTPTSSNKSLSVIAARIAHDRTVQLAISEYARGAVGIITPEALRAVRQAVADPSAKDHIRAVGMVLDRAVPAEQVHSVTVDFSPPSEEVTAQVLARIQSLAARAGLPPQPTPPALPPVLDGDFEVVTGE
jgi:hypothetical protein